nr:Armadillo-like helical [Ipomoea batatas]GME20543.1 Armadillo-like helical [Ipomoea batatas]
MKEESQQILRVLEALKQASQELQANPIGNSVDSDSPSPAIEALLQLGETESDSILASDPRLSALSRHLSDLKALVSSLHESKRGRFTSFLTRRVRSNAISRVAGSIEAEIKAWIDREAVRGLTCHLRRLRALETPLSSREAAAIEEKLTNFHDKLAQGFDLNFQDLLLRSRIFPELEFVVCSENLPKGVRENAAYALKQLVLFNKDVFVGQVLTGQSIKALVSMRTMCSLEVISRLIRAIKSPLVDILESVGGIPSIMTSLNSDDLGIKINAMECVLEIGYFGRKEAVEAMLNAGLIKMLVELQRSELGGD